MVNLHTSSLSETSVFTFIVAGTLGCCIQHIADINTINPHSECLSELRVYTFIVVNRLSHSTYFRYRYNKFTTWILVRNGYDYLVVDLRLHDHLRSNIYMQTRPNPHQAIRNVEQRKHDVHIPL